MELMKLISLYISVLSLLCFTKLQGQSVEYRSKQIIDSDLSVQEKLDSLLNFTTKQVRQNTDSGRVVAMVLRDYAQEKNNTDFEGDALHYIGVSYAWQGKYEKAMDYYGKSLETYQVNQDPKRISLIYTSIGGVYFDQNKYLENLEYWLLAKSFSEKSDDEKSTEVCNNNLGALYMRIGKNEEAKKLFEENLALGIKNDWVVATGYAYINLASIYLENNQLDTAEMYARKSFDIHTKVGNERQAASVLQNLSEIEFKKGNKEISIQNAQEMVETMKRLKDDYNFNNGRIFLGMKYLEIQEYSKALSICKKAYQASKEIQSLGMQKSACKCMSKASAELGDFVNAYSFEMEFQELEDSILNDNVSLDLAKREYEIGYQLKAEKDSLERIQLAAIEELEHQSELDQQKSETDRQRHLTYFGLILAVIASGMALYVFVNFQKKKKANKEILLSKQIIEVKNKEITDSINYARRIQTAMLPSKEHCSAILNSHFVYYQPKDIVAGDFYWVEEKNDTKYFAIADCTGHGVPGAMMSVVCNNALNRSLREFDLNDPGEILDKTRELIIKELNKGDSENEVSRGIKDGMDIALVSMGQGQEEGVSVLRFAGAYNSLFIVRSSEEIHASGEVNIRSYGNLNLVELKADKQPVGIGHSKNPFSTKMIRLEKGDMIYAFSDGYADQFGNASQIEEEKNPSFKPQGKKFKSSNLKKLLVKISSHSISRQKELLQTNFETWKGGIEQLDDVCVMGVKIED